jgi:prevent-host-death family protein
MQSMTVTELRKQLLDVVRRCEAGGEGVEVVRHGRLVARVVPAAPGPAGLLGADEGSVRLSDDDEALFSTGADWDAG